MEKAMFYTLLTEKDKKLPVYPVSTGCFPGQDTVIRPNGMPFHQIFVVTHGKGVYTCAGKTYALEAGTCFYVPKDTVHEYYGTDKTFTTRWVAFDGENVSELLEALGLCEGCAFGGGLQSAFYYAQQQVMEQALQNADNAVLSAHTYSALVHFAQLRTAGNSSSAAIEKAQAFMELHMDKTITLDEIAAQAGMSKYNFCRVFKKNYGVSAFEHLMQLRIRSAKQLLAGQKDLSVAEIAAKTGFSDAGYFIKCFKKIEHITPLEFRKTRI